MSSSTSTRQRTFAFKRDGKSLRLSISAADVTLRRLSTAFQVKEETMYLKEECNDATVWPCDNGKFNFNNVMDGASFLVMGDDKDTEITPPSTVGNSLSYTYGPSTSGLSTKALRAISKKSSGVTFPLKVVLAEINKTPKGLVFQEQMQTYINISEETANVSFIKEKMKEKVGEEVTLVSSNGLSIDEEEGTKDNR